jgi:hypothetical protein
MRPSEYFGCATGDCPHKTERECVEAMLRLADELHEEVERQKEGMRRRATIAKRQVNEREALRADVKRLQAEVGRLRRENKGLKAEQAAEAGGE